MVTEQNIQKFSQQCKNIFEQIERDVIGQKDIVEETIIAMIAGGNVLLEGVPGVGKTRLVRTLGRVFDLPFSRIQFTPDLMPADVTGTNIIVKDENGNSSFQFQPGPVFSNIILADEINRATPKTQSALLEAMQEHTVTVMGVSRKLNEPFFVLATQNPIEQDGTYPLPEAQMDRFMFKLIVKNPTLDELMDIVNLTQKTMAEVADAACSGEELLQMRATANAIPVAQDVMRYAMTLCSATHPDSECATEAAKKYVRVGASPRAGQALISAAKVKALMEGRYNVSYEDLNTLAYPVLRHRMKLNFGAVAERVSADEIVKMIIAEVSKKYKLVSELDEVTEEVASTTEETTDETAGADKKAKRKFGRK
jgi:MoxR-like ATPase